MKVLTLSDVQHCVGDQPDTWNSNNACAYLKFWARGRNGSCRACSGNLVVIGWQWHVEGTTCSRCSKKPGLCLTGTYTFVSLRFGAAAGVVEAAASYLVAYNSPTQVPPKPTRATPGAPALPDRRRRRRRPLLFCTNSLYSMLRPRLVFL